jgi:hypothetical protein
MPALLRQAKLITGAPASASTTTPEREATGTSRSRVSIPLRRDVHAGHLKGGPVVALIILLLILAIFGGLGFAVHFLWFVLIAALILWLIGFFVGGGIEAGRRRKWYGRW